ncbi:UNVERIFIED_CONTAM: hypothetical protein Slati_0212100 [Sesamum latifolium]|uniref:Transposase n=1 Tax=Sesamum latifolium TaxID=2727402 RepID=A0AAW2YCM6_9LAMI
MKDTDGIVKIACIHCMRMYTKSKTAATTQLHQHLQSCANYLKAKADKPKDRLLQTQLAFGSNSVDPTTCPSLYVRKFDMKKMKESVAHWIKRVLNFVHIPPPRRGLEIANAIWHCLEDWGIESKIHTISVDNASSNDVAIDNLKIYVKNKRRLLYDGRLFHVRCCAHILNLIAQDGLSEIKNIVAVIRESVEYVRRSDARLKIFFEIVKQLNLPDKKLVDDCRTRWNSTYEMLAAAIKFKDVFPRFADREPHYDICPSAEDWTNAEKVCSVLELFWTATHIVTGSDYPTSNLFLMR